MKLEWWADVSAFQNGLPVKPIDFAKMGAAGIDGVCIRKSLGTLQDVAFKMNWEGAGAAGLKRTIYVVPYVQFDRARQFEAMTKDINPALLDRPMWLDVERSHPLTLQQAAATILWFLFELTAWGSKPDIYTNRYLWEKWYSTKGGWIDDWRLVIANYGAVIPSIPAGWRTRMDGTKVEPMQAWSGFQYAADGDGLGKYLGCHSQSIDLSWEKV